MVARRWRPEPPYQELKMARIKALEAADKPVAKPSEPIVAAPTPEPTTPPESVSAPIDDFIKIAEPPAPRVTLLPHTEPFEPAPQREVTGHRLRVQDGKLVNELSLAPEPRPAPPLTERMQSKLEAEQAAGRAALAKHAARAEHYRPPPAKVDMTPVYRPTEHFVAQKDPVTGATIRFAPPPRNPNNKPNAE
jgi:hypothetical protein